MIFKRSQEKEAFYYKRNNNRVVTVAKATMALVKHYEDQAGAETTEEIAAALVDANAKVDAVSYYLLKNHLYALVGYEKGNSLCKDDLIAAINGMDEVTYPNFKAPEKKILTDILTLVV